MKKEFDIFKIEYTKDDLDYIDDLVNYLKNNYKDIMYFFNLKEFNKKIEIKLWNDINLYRQSISNKYNVKIPDWEVARGYRGKKGIYIDLLPFNECKKAKGHSNDKLEYLLSVVIHEFVHVCQFEYNNSTPTLTWFNEALATNLSHQYDNYPLTLDVSLDSIINGQSSYINYYTMGKYMLGNYDDEYILELTKNNELLIKETPRLYQETKWFVCQKKLEKYMDQNIDCPKYLFHGSPKKLNKITPMLPHDSNNNPNNVDNALYLSPFIITASAYAFKDTIKKNSEGMDYNFQISNQDIIPIMTMENVNIDDNMIGYIYVFNIDKDIIKDKDSYQYKCFKELIPFEVIEVYYHECKKFYKIIKRNI